MAAVFSSHSAADFHHDGCPQCSGSILRTGRRPIDRFISGFSPVQRFRCESFRCRWEGNIRVRREEPVRYGSQPADVEAPQWVSEPALPWSFVVSSSIAFAGFVAIVALAFEAGAL